MLTISVRIATNFRKQSCPILDRLDATFFFFGAFSERRIYPQFKKFSSGGLRPPDSPLESYISCFGASRSGIYPLRSDAPKKKRCQMPTNLVRNFATKFSNDSCYNFRGPSRLGFEPRFYICAFVKLFIIYKLKYPT